MASSDVMPKVTIVGRARIDMQPAAGEWLHGRWTLVSMVHDTCKIKEQRRPQAAFATLAAG
ncbi:hypothetical protein [Cupriavidus numazuensis]|uniref:hypothetical protein n=1 Tax=Cupriavidus numazuensis TaxID=221992 RepID=UPI001BA8B684|nr:hypothetical protein [Cupriavidus numazuensis]